MSSPSPDPQPARMRAVLEPTAAPHLDFGLAEQIAALRSERPWQAGRNSKTLVKFPDFRVVLTVMRGGTRIPGHHADGRVTIQAIEGHLRVRTPGAQADLPSGRLLALDRGVPHDVEALADSAFLLTIAWPGTAHAALPKTDAL